MKKRTLLAGGLAACAAPAFGARSRMLFAFGSGRPAWWPESFERLCIIGCAAIPFISNTQCLAQREKSMILTRLLRAEIRYRRERPQLIAGRLVPGSIAFIRQLLAEVSDPHDRDELLGELAGEYLRAGFDDEHLLVQRERLANHPDAAIMWLGLAHTLSMRSDGAEEAKQAVAKGVAIARRTDALVRYALTCQAEVARRTNDPDLYTRALGELINDAPNPRQEDSGMDGSILRDLPDDFCPVGIQGAYLDAIRKFGPNPGSSADADAESPKG